jgi:hypothetical protein
MKTPSLLVAAALVPLFSACNTAVPAKSDAAITPEPAWVNGARDVSTSVPPKLLAVLLGAIQKSGPADAIGVCKDEAPRMARAASEQTGWQVRRVSLGNRNPMAVPDAWERKALEAFDRSQAAGTDPSKLERWEVVTENGQPVRRYMRALPTQPLCVQCHGTSDKLGAGVAERLAQLYPNDRGTGYGVGQIRGAMTLRQPGP